MNEKGNRYALAALKHRRGLLAADIINLQSQLQARKDALIHVDATIKLLDPSVNVSQIVLRRVVKRIRLFGQGELGRMILAALRQADGAEITTAQIVDHVVAAGGHKEGARAAFVARVRSNLAYLVRRGVVAKTGSQRGARWSIAG